MSVSFCVVSLSSCTTLVEREFPSFASKPVVNSILVDGKPLSIHISLAAGLNSTILPNIDYAQIDLFVDGQFKQHIEHVENGIYVSTENVVHGKTYTCKILVPPFDTLICTQKVPTPLPILKVEHVNSTGRDEEGSVYHSFKITIKKTTTERCFLEIVSDAGTFRPFTDPILVSEGLPIALFNTDFIRDSIFSVSIDFLSSSKLINGQRVLNPYVVQLRSISTDYYQFKKQLALYENGRYGDIISKTSAISIFSNIDNAYGIFAAYSVSVSDTLKPGPYESQK